MTQPENATTNRREFLKTTGKAAAAVSALAGVTLPHVHAQGSDQLKIVLIGAGGRGGGAVGNALSVKKGSAKLVAVADVFEHRLNGTLGGLKGNADIKDDIEVTNDSKFLGFDAYKHAMDMLRPGDIAIFTTPLAFRWVHFQYAIEKNLNVFMEKPITADGPSSRKMLALAEEAKKKNLKVGVGLMSRHSKSLNELHKRIQDGEIGDIQLMRGYRMQGVIGSMASIPRLQDPAHKDKTDLMHQIARFHSFLWLSGGAFSDFYIHHVDHLCWMKNDWPVKCQGVGGRHYKKSPEGIEYIDQNFDSYSIEYTFADGAKMYMDGRCINGAVSIYNSWVHGTKGLANAAKSNDCDGPASIYKNQNPIPENRIWESQFNRRNDDPYLNEWVALQSAIRNNTPHNEVERGVKASVTCNMGRLAAHCGQEITFDEALNHEHNYAPNVDKLTFDSASPLMPDANGRYPKPEPGQIGKREYGETAA